MVFKKSFQQSAVLLESGSAFVMPVKEKVRK